MDSELKWLFALILSIVLFNSLTNVIQNYWKHQLAIEAIKSGLSQDTNGNWTKLTNPLVEK